LSGGGLWGLSHSPGPAKSMDCRGFLGTTTVEPPLLKRKKYLSLPFDKFLTTRLITQEKWV